MGTFKLALCALTMAQCATQWSAYAADLESAQSVAASIAFLAQRQDEFSFRISGSAGPIAVVPVYDDVSSGGNHFVVFGKIGDVSAVSVNGSWASNPHSGATTLRFGFTPSQTSQWGGLYMLNGVFDPRFSGMASPQPNWGNHANAGFAGLSGARRLTFWARGESGGERVEFFVGGVGRVGDPGPFECAVIQGTLFPDSSCATPRKLDRPVRQPPLTTAWQQYSIDVSGQKMTYVLGGFGWTATTPVTFYVDNIQFELAESAGAARRDAPRFVRSYLTADIQPDVTDANKNDDFDLVLRNSAYAYDNALVILAFLAEGSADSLRRARLIGEAFLYALDHDRWFGNDRVRSDYAAGDISLPPGWTVNGKTATVPVPGFYKEPSAGQAIGDFQEVGQGSIDTGNNAWVMLALTALFNKTADDRYLQAARRIGGFVRSMYSASGTYPGFLGGLDNAENKTQGPIVRAYASVEHNLDLNAAFQMLAIATGDNSWLVDAARARQMVASQFNANGCLLAGTTNDTTRNTNPFQLPVDVQAWAILSPGAVSTSRIPGLLNCVMSNHAAVADGYAGYDFNNDRDGVWFEGSAHVAVAQLAVGRVSEADTVRAMLRSAQNAPGVGDGGGLPAASHDGVSTGFDAEVANAQCPVDPTQCTFKLFKRKHIGATAWNVFAQLGHNPYTQTPAGSPSAPTAVSSYPSGNGELAVRFRPPDSPGASPVQGFFAVCTSTNGGVSNSNTGTPQATSILVRGLTPGKTYSCNVTARNAVGAGIPSFASAPATTVNLRMLLDLLLDAE